MFAHEANNGMKIIVQLSWLFCQKEVFYIEIATERAEKVDDFQSFRLLLCVPSETNV